MALHTLQSSTPHFSCHTCGHTHTHSQVLPCRHAHPCACNTPFVLCCVRESESWSSRSTSRSHSSRSNGTLEQVSGEGGPAEERALRERGERLSSDLVGRLSSPALTSAAGLDPHERSDEKLRQISSVRRSTPSRSSALGCTVCWCWEDLLRARGEAGRGSRGTWVTMTLTELEG